ncbi:hypothetical protein DXG03_009051 [Asterophora parasitica]|uniref:Conserved oligomeric Golgi complex subunit 8 n=1 Tax=Asterophora parasitica TaxID=117018 RepID=A0A9P7KA34_9AGAR|nr:hypothetical protein DXG03_009051 [Asterophora parasitica]
MDYSSHLTSLALADLVAEPSSLQTQAHHLTSSLTSLTHTSYPSFLALHQSTSALTHALDALDDSLGSLLHHSLPALQDATAAWNTRTSHVLAERSKARQVLDHHDRIKDLLDIPLFIDSCVRNAYFQEALALAAHVAAMAAKPGAPLLVLSVHAEVQAAVAQMLVVLLQTLNEPGRKLPALWKAVNFLRKMDAFGSDSDSEELLALAFLSGRLACLAAALEPTARDIHRLTSANDDGLSDRDKEDIARYLKKYIDVWREGAYDIITQYSTIFLEPHLSSSSHPASPPSLTSRRFPTSSLSPSLPHSTAPSLSTPPPTLHPHLPAHLLSHLLPLLTSALPLLPLPLLPALLTQLSYCAAAFARLGLDLHAPFGLAIQHAVVRAVHRGVEGAGDVFTYGKGGRDLKPSEWLVTPSHLEVLLSSSSSPPSVPPSNSGPAHIPPPTLTSFPPLARYTNALLSVLNALRLLAPLAVLADVVREVEEALRSAGEGLRGYLGGYLAGGGEKDELDEKEEGDEDGDGEEKKTEEREERTARAVRDAYFGVLVPFVTRALVEGVYGVPVGEFEFETFDH